MELLGGLSGVIGIVVILGLVLLFFGLITGQNLLG